MEKVIRRDNKKQINKLCEGCWRWHKFGSKCYFYWHEKKLCTQYSDEEETREDITFFG